MLELYQTVNSVCAQKIRIALAEKGLDYAERNISLNGDQYKPEYLKLNPNAVVPTLIHDGQPVIESSVILYYLEDAFPMPSLMPPGPRDRARVRLYNKLIDEYVHPGCAILTFATAFRKRSLAMSDDDYKAGIAGMVYRKFIDYKLSVREKGIESEYVIEALKSHDKMLTWMEEALEQAPYIAGSSYSLAEAAVIPYILRLELIKLDRMWAKRPRVAEWWERIRARPSTVAAIFDRMGPADYAPFESYTDDPWPKAQAILEAV
ncbi:MAG: glutathione S-transferase family protein [Hyphomicrobiaceae bacterium]